MKNIFFKNKFNWICLCILLVIVVSSCADEKSFYFKNGNEISKTQFNDETFKINQFKKDTFTIYLAKPYG
jgi:hypothetical protein